MPLRRNRIIATLFCLTVLALPALPMVATATEIQGDALQSVHSKILNRHTGVEHLSVGKFAEMLEADPDGLLILDVREPKEYAVSHIKSAIRVAPGISIQTFLKRFGSKLRGRHVVLYCSVGERSSQLAKQVQRGGNATGVNGIYNLAGGIFNWHNQRRPLTSANGETDLVHPYNWWWSRLVERRALASYKPQRLNAN